MLQQLVMNLILFTQEEILAPLKRIDPRARHVLEILRCGRGDSFDMGIIDGPRGKAEILEIGEDEILLDIFLESHIPELYPVSLIVGLPRPAGAKRILRSMTTMGVGAILFAATERGETSYRKSSLWSESRFTQYLREGAEQAFCTRLPRVELFDSLSGCLDRIAAQTPPNIPLIALDNYEAQISLKDRLVGARAQEPPITPRDGSARSGRKSTPACVLAVGSERGWSSGERDLLRDREFDLVNLGKRVLKTETACIAATAIALSALGFM